MARAWQSTPRMSETWVRSFLSRLDSMQTDEVLPAFAEDACFRVGNEATVIGSQSIRRAIARMFAPLAQVRHELRHVWCPHPGTAIVEADVHYVRKDGKSVTLAQAEILRFEGQHIVDYRILIDPAPLAA